eukprot:TRINITY_DN2864_c0_g1_i26.p1 TRINITY_DN2864_c0_g1~~TRINITY_DN2864_c0_g1_i26.p1  ORF type:complete len:415 (-),score=81.61 TRINITY_DN2864_c0_g1_i26:19-1263(-)
MLKSIARLSGNTLKITPSRLLGAPRFFSSNARLPVTSFSEEEVILQESVAKFAREVVQPLVKEMDEHSKLDMDLLSDCFNQGLMGIETPEELKGTGMSFTSSIIAIEELAKVDPAISVIVDVQNTLINTSIRKWGSKSLQEKFLPQLAESTLGSFCLSEWESGSDAFAMKTRAEKKGDHFVINGTKAWITNAEQAGLFIVLANADPSKGYKGITAFVVPRDTPGLSIGKKEDKLGIRASSTCEVTFTNVKVPETNILGEYGKGYKIAIECLNEGRIGIAGQMIGLAQGAFDATMPYIIERKQFGQSIADFQGMQFSYADLATDIMSGRLLTYHAARLKENGLPFVTEAAMAKLTCSRVARKVTSACISMLGGVGFTKDFAVEKFYRDAAIGEIYEGTTNIQLQTIAKHIKDQYK